MKLKQFLIIKSLHNINVYIIVNVLLTGDDELEIEKKLTANLQKNE